MTLAPDPLSEQDLAKARAELAEGRPVPVWFTPSAVGVPAGGSAKVVAIDDAGEGDFIQVRPTGSRDTMFCSPNELTSTRPPRKRAQPASKKAPGQPEPPPAVPGGEQGGERNGRQVGTPPPAASPEDSHVPGSTPGTRPERTPDTTPEKKAPARSRPPGGRSAARPAEVTLVLNSSSEGEWSVEVTVGKKRAVRAIPVQPADVAMAARALPAAVGEAIESSLEAARRLQAERVARLRVELEAAERALQELNGRPN
jgi:hypothetical protein